MNPKIDVKHKLQEFTPVEMVGGMYLKREDKFAPLGYGGINGSKVRQCIYSFDKYIEESDKPLGLLSGASVKSSQLAVGSFVAWNYGLPSIHVIGATTPRTAIKHEQVKIAHHLGARFDIIKVAYNPALQRRVRDLHEGPLAGWFKLEYGSGINQKEASPEEVTLFHRVGANQVQNIPDEVTTLIVPAGSCNTLVSVLYGIKLFEKNINKVICLQIGPDKFQETQEKLYDIEAVTGLDLRGIQREYLPLHKIWSYQDEVPYDYHGISMHPTYEGKCFRYLQEHQELVNEHTCFWLTGSKPYLKNIMSEEPNYQAVGVWND